MLATLAAYQIDAVQRVIGGRLDRIAFGLQMWASMRGTSVAFESGVRKFLRITNPQHGVC
jgi:hypothetical protein